MRIRQVKPEFWADSDMSAIPFRARLTYIGLWGIADDTGWLPKVNPTELGRELWGYNGVRLRERWIVDDLVTLQAVGCIEVLLCGHAIIPMLPVHQRSAAATRRVEVHRKAHQSRCAAESSGEQPYEAEGSGLPPRNGKVGNGKEQGTERNGTVAGASATTETTEFSARVPRPA